MLPLGVYSNPQLNDDKALMEKMKTDKTKIDEETKNAILDHYLNSKITVGVWERAVEIITTNAGVEDGHIFLHHKDWDKIVKYVKEVREKHENKLKQHKRRKYV